MATTEERLAALEARLGPEAQALTPPITIGELANVPAPGSQLAAGWAQDVSSRVVQRFANKAAIDGYAAPNGVYVVAVDTGIMWRRVGGVWSQATPWWGNVAGVASAGVASANVATLTIPADPGPRLALLSCFLQLNLYNTASCYVWLVFDGVAVVEWFQTPTVQLQAGGGGMSWNVAMTATVFPPAGRAANAVISVQGSAAAWATVAGPVKNRLDALVVPR